MGNDVEAAFTDEKTDEVKQSGDSRPFALAGLALLLGVVGVAVGSAGLAKANSKNNLNEGGPKLYPYPGFSFAMEEGF